MLFNNELEKILKHFTDTQKSYIRDIVDFSSLRLDDDNTYTLLKMIRSIDDTSTDFDKDVIIEILEKIFVQKRPPCMKIVANGEDWFLTIVKRPDDDFSSRILLARDASNDSALTDDTYEGDTYANKNEETINFLDYAGTEGSFQKVYVLLEEMDSGGTANGEANTLIATIYVYVQESIDSN